MRVRGHDVGHLEGAIQGLWERGTGRWRVSMLGGEEGWGMARMAVLILQGSSGLGASLPLLLPVDGARGGWR